jgi:DNA ligase (NAD+)
MLDPTVVAGSTISMATLHNPDDIIRKDIRPGEMVIIEKAGDVIPRVVGPVDTDPARSIPRWIMPTACPVCGTELVKAEDEAVWRCENSSCPTKLRRGLEHFASRGAMNIEGMGESLCALLCDHDLVHSYADIYQLDAAKLEALPRMGNKSAAKVLAQIEKSKTNDIWRLLYGLGIRHVGERGAQVLADHFGSIDAIETARIRPLVFRRAGESRVDRGISQCGREARRRGEARARRPATSCGKDLCDHGGACRHVPRRGAGEARGARGEGDRFRQQEDDGADRRHRTWCK